MYKYGAILWYNHIIEKVIRALKNDLNYCHIQTNDYKYDEMLKALNQLEMFYYKGDQCRLNYIPELQRKYDALKIIAKRYTNDYMFKELSDTLDKVKKVDEHCSIVYNYKECADQLVHCILCDNHNTTFMNYMVETACNHTFHVKCIRKYISDCNARWCQDYDACPYCKRPYHELQTYN